MRVHLLLFAVLKDIAGFDQRWIEVPQGSRPLDLWNQLRRDHQKLASFEKPPMTAVNQTYADAGSPLAEGDEVAFIPPVAGG